MAKQGNILVVDDNKSILTALKLLLGNYFAKVVTIPSPKTLMSALREENFDVILLDMNFSAGINSGNEGLYWLSEIKKYDHCIPVVLFTAYADIDLAVKAVKEGATDFIVKPWDNARLLATLMSACNLGRSQKEVKHLKEINRSFKSSSDMFWGKSPAMRKLRDIVRKVAATDANILITGENGTGKEMLAKEMHALSARRDEPFVAVDMGALTESLFESELFGHVKGAFTDARIDRAGKFEAASGGTLFLDEIGNLPVHLQAKLLSVIQSRQVTRVGSNTPTPINIRLICATNRDITNMVATGEFREDLLYRVNTIHVAIPLLRERKEDIIPLAEIFLKRYAAKYGKSIKGLTKAAEAKLTSYQWAGNIRELQHSMEKAVILCDGDVVDTDDFLLLPIKETYSDEVLTLEEMEETMIRKSMDKYRGNLTRVASKLGISRQTLYNKLKKYKL